jgi:tRNA(Ile)-lysidine synthase
MQHDSTRAVLRAARAAVRATDAPFVLAVSGGLDSMALMHAMASVARARIAMVATLDHGTGAAATAAAAHVATTAAGLGLPVASGCITLEPRAADGREAAWRRARYRFLESVAAPLHARIVAAHTEDDQVETVLMRVLRGSGARGLAGLYSPSAVLRPFVQLRRATLADYAEREGIVWHDDPSNTSPAFFRNRVRHDLLPALRQVNPALDDDLLALARRAAAWRADVEAFVDATLQPRRVRGALRIAAAELSGYDRDSLSVLWGALAGRLGLSLDRRGTHRLAAFTMREPRSGTVPLSGGWCMEARGGVYILEQRPQALGTPAPLPDRGELEWGGFRFRVETPRRPATPADAGGDHWTAALPLEAQSSVRAWGAGDRLAPAGGQPARRVKRYLSDAGLRGSERVGWPVVITGEGMDVVWIPGVRRADAATERSGRPVRHYVCERIDR